MVYAILGGIWFVLTTVVGALMYASQIGPDQAASNLSLWAKKFGVEDPPEWLKKKSADKKVRRWATIALSTLLVSGGFLAGMVFDDYVRQTPSSAPTISERDWGSLSDEEKALWPALIRISLRSWGKQNAVIYCADADGLNLADAFSELFADLGWDRKIVRSYVDFEPDRRGLFLVGNEGITKPLANAIEAATKGRLSFKFVNMDAREGTFNIVMGRKPNAKKKN
jgi:hypothetical protein